MTFKSTKGLVGHWTMDFVDTFGGRDTTMYDRSAYNNHANLSGNTISEESPSAPPSGIPIGGAVDLVRSDSDSLSISNSDSLSWASDDATFSAWIYFDDSPADIGSQIAIFSDTITGSGAGAFGGYWKDTEGIRWEVDDGSNTSVVTSGSGPISVNTWIHICATFKGSTPENDLRIYIDAVEQGSTTSPATGIDNVGADAKGIGIDSGRAKLDGKITDVRLYDRELSADEVNSLYQMREQKLHRI